MGLGLAMVKNIVETDNGEHKEDTTLNPDKGMKK